MIYYPVIIPTLCRYEHLKNCIESLSQCTGAENTEIYVGLDYPPSEAYREGYEAIKAYLPTVKGFKQVFIFERTENLGAVGNAEDLISVVAKKYDAYIFTEDDNVFSPNFLEFMNQGLEKYADDDRVSSICGYNFPHIKIKKNENIILRPIVAAWGVGRWNAKDFGSKQYRTHEFHLSILRSLSKSLKVLFTNPAELSMLTSMTKKNIIWDDVSRSVYNIINKKYQLSPVISMVRNIGHDGTGEHCNDKVDIYSNQIIDQSKCFKFGGIASFSSLSLKYDIFRCMMPQNFFKFVYVFLSILCRYIIYRMR